MNKSNLFNKVSHRANIRIESQSKSEMSQMEIVELDPQVPAKLNSRIRLDEEEVKEGEVQDRY